VLQTKRVRRSGA